MISFGEVPASSVLPIPFDSFAGSTGASITITGLAIGDVKIFKGTSMTERSSTAGIVLMDTDGIDLDGITGIQGFSIDLSDNTDAGFYAVGSFFWVVVSSITVDSQTVNFLAGTFRIKAAENTVGVPVVDLARILGTALTETAGQIAAAVKKFFNVAAPTGTVNSIPDAVAGVAGGLFIAGTNAATTVTTSFTTTFTGNLTGSVASVTGAVDSVTGNVGGNVVGSVASVTAGVTVTTNNDKTGYTLTVTPPTSAQIASAVWGATGDGAYTYAQMLGYSWAFAAGTLSGVSSNAPVFVSKGGNFTISAIQGADGRSSVTLS